MQTVSREKAENYARYGLPYADEAVRFVLDQVRPAGRTVADIGAGTGLLTQHFVGRADTVYAVEPELHMRAVLERDLKGVVSVDGTAEATGLWVASGRSGTARRCCSDSPYTTGIRWGPLPVPPKWHGATTHR